MKIFCKKIVGLIGLVIGVCALASNGCQNADAPSLYNPGTLPQPIVDSLSPAAGALAGIDTVSVFGRNFSADKSNDGVYFNSTLLYNTSIISATTTKLVMKAPTISGDSISVRVYVIGAVDFSPTVIYKLRPAIGPFSTFASGEAPYGLSAGTDTNLYASLSNSNLAVKDEGIFELTPAGTRLSPAYVLPTTSPINTNWLSIKYGPLGSIYAVKGTRAIYKLAPGVANPGASPWAALGSGAFNDLDFDPDHNVWVGGSGVKTGSDTTNIIRFASDASSRTFHFPGTVRAVRYFSGYLYIAAVTGGASQILRTPWAADTIGTPLVYFDVSSVYSGVTPNIYAVSFSTDGDMYVGLDGPDYLIIVHPGGIAEMAYQLYVSSGVLSSPCKSLAWIGTSLYASTSAGGLLKVNTGKQSAPYFGTQ